MRRRLSFVVGSLVSLTMIAVLAQGAGSPVAMADRLPVPGVIEAGSQAAPALPGLIAYVIDSNFYTSNGKDTLATVEADGKNPRVLISSASADIGLLSLSPDGQELAYFYGNESTAGVRVMALSTKKVTSLFKLRGTTGFIDGIAWSADGTHLIVGSNEHPGTTRTHKEAALWSVPVGGGPALRLSSFEDAGSPAVGTDGDIFYVVSKSFSSSSTSLEKSALWMMSATGASPRTVLSSSHFMESPAPAPNGQTVVVSVIDNETTAHLESITLVRGTGSNLTPVRKGRTDVQPSWSPDGSHIAFLSSRAGRHESTKSEQLLDAYEMTATGGDVAELLGFRSGTQSVGAIDWGR